MSRVESTKVGEGVGNLIGPFVSGNMAPAQPAPVGLPPPPGKKVLCCRARHCGGGGDWWEMAGGCSKQEGFASGTTVGFCGTGLWVGEGGEHFSFLLESGSIFPLLLPGGRRGDQPLLHRLADRLGFSAAFLPFFGVACRSVRWVVLKFLGGGGGSGTTTLRRKVCDRQKGNTVLFFPHSSSFSFHTHEPHQAAKQGETRGKTKGKEVV